MSRIALRACVNVDDLRRAAGRRLPGPLYGFLTGGADDEETLRRSTSAFSSYELLPDTLTDVSVLDTRVDVLGRSIAWPVLLAPTGATRMFHPDGELAVARAASRAGTFYSLSTMATTTLEEVARASDGPKIFQLYVFKDRDITRALVERCKAAGYDALCLTVDMPVGGNRERDIRSGLILPPRPSLRGWASFLLHPRWSIGALGVSLGPVNLTPSTLRESPARGAPMRLVDAQFDRSVTWRDVEWLASLWGGPLIVKGVLTGRDARRAADAGAMAVMVSAHGGRQMDGVPAPVDCIAEIRAEVGQRLQIILDGGVRRGTHVLKALALGANACSIGRPYLYGLVAAGERGVDRALSLLRAEIERDMALMGCPTIAAVQSRHVRRVGAARQSP